MYGCEWLFWIDWKLPTHCICLASPFNWEETWQGMRSPSKDRKCNCGVLQLWGPQNWRVHSLAQRLWHSASDSLTPGLLVVPEKTNQSFKTLTTSCGLAIEVSDVQEGNGLTMLHGSILIIGQNVVALQSVSKSIRDQLRLTSILTQKIYDNKFQAVFFDPEWH